MGSENPESDLNPEMDDSGCIQDDSPAKKPGMENGYVGQAQLLDLSDDVLLCILKYLTPHELKALGYTCSRLGSLVLERSLWARVDARGVRCGRARARWLLHALHGGTRALLLTGRARALANTGCLGHVNRTRKEVEDAKGRKGAQGECEDHINETLDEILGTDEPREENNQNGGGIGPPYPLFRQHARLFVNCTAQHQLPRMSGSPSWPDSDSDSEAEAEAEAEERPRGWPRACAGPQFTLSRRMLRTLADRCPLLQHLHLDYCNINCNKTSIKHFPSSLKRLSLRGTKCFNLPLDKSFLFKIHDYLPLVEYLDLSECAWLEPVALLPLSKMESLATLLMRDCGAMTEFVAYVSLATRYGFRKLRELDLSGSPVGDSEVSALGWLPSLERLRLSAPTKAHPSKAPPHHHYRDEPPRHLPDTEPWELQEPEYYRHRHRCESQSPDTSIEDVEEQVEKIRNQITIDVYTRPQVASESVQPERLEREEETTKRRHETDADTDPGPSKRTKIDLAKCSDTSDDNSELSDEEPGAKRIKLAKKCNNSDENSEKNKPGPSRSETKGAGLSDEKSTNDSNNNESKVMYHFFHNRINDSGPRIIYPHRSSDSEAGSSQALTRNETGTNDSNRTINISIRNKIPNENKNNDTENIIKQDENENRSKNNEIKDVKTDFNSDEDVMRVSTNHLDEQASTSNQNCSGAEPTLNDSHTSSNSHTLNSLPYSDYSLTSGSEPSAAIRNSQASTSSSSSSSSNEDQKTQEPVQKYVRFRQNERPVVIQHPLPEREVRQPERVEPRHHILYVNLGQQFHGVYRLLQNRPGYSIRSRTFRSMAQRLDASSLVSDASIRHFGRAENAVVNIINIGGPFVNRETGERPSRSNLRYLSATGYRNISNSSLIHLATAAPHLEFVDFSETGVTEAGVENFLTLRPDCKVKFSEFKEDNWEEDDE